MQRLLCFVSGFSLHYRSIGATELAGSALKLPSNVLQKEFLLLVCFSSVLAWQY